MSTAQKILSDEQIDRLVSVATQVNDKSPSDPRSGDKWPMAGLAMQYFLIEDGREFQKEMLRQQQELVRGTWWMVRLAALASIISVVSAITAVMAIK